MVAIKIKKIGKFLVSFFLICLMCKFVHNQIHTTGFGEEPSQVKMNLRFELFILFNKLMNVKLFFMSVLMIAHQKCIL